MAALNVGHFGNGQRSKTPHNQVRYARISHGKKKPAISAGFCVWPTIAPGRIVGGFMTNREL
jgi:hypothetical protein